MGAQSREKKVFKHWTHDISVGDGKCWTHKHVSNVSTQSQWPTNCLLFHVISSVMKVTRAHVHSSQSGFEEFVFDVNRVAFNETV